MKLQKIASSAMVLGVLAVPGTSYASNGLLSGVSGVVTATTNGVSNVVSSATDGGLVNVGVNGNSVNVNPAVGLNLLSSGNTTATATQTVNTTVAGTGSTGHGLVNVGVNGNSVNLNPSVCANVLSSGNCTSTATQTVTTVVTSGNPDTPGKGGVTGSVLGAAVTPASSLPRTGSSALSYILSAIAAVTVGGLSFLKQRANGTIA